MASLAALGAYKGSDSESDDENKNCQKKADEQLHLVAPSHGTSAKSRELTATPNVITRYDLNFARCIDTQSGEIVFNPTATELYTPEQV